MLLLLLLLRGRSRTVMVGRRGGVGGGLKRRGWVGARAKTRRSVGGRDFAISIGLGFAAMFCGWRAN